MSTGWKETEVTKGVEVLACRKFDYDGLSLTSGERFTMTGQRNDAKLMSNGFVSRVPAGTVLVPCPDTKCKGRKFLPESLALHTRGAHEPPAIREKSEAQFRAELKERQAEDEADFAFAARDPVFWNELQESKRQLLQERTASAPNPDDVARNVARERAYAEAVQDDEARQQRIDEELKARWGL